jgi:predicted metal-dependent peptidase
MSGERTALRLAASRARAVDRMPYLATALFAMHPVRTSQVPTFAVDERWRLYWNPEWVLANATEELAGVWLHEAGHLLREHAARFAALAAPPAARPRFGVAADAAINEDLRAGGVPLPDRPVYVELIPGGLPGMTTEELYRLLTDGPGDEARDGDGELRDGDDQAWDGDGAWDCGSGADGERRPWDLPAPEDGDPDGGVDEGRAQRIRWQVAQEVRAAARGIGDVPGGLARWADELLAPRVDWRAELESAVRRKVATVAGVRDYTYARPSRRAAVSPGIVLPAMRRPRPPEVTVVVDTSGSMTPALLAQCLAEVQGIVRRAARGGRGVRLVACDTGTGAVQRLRSVESVAELDLTGGGGTDLRPAIRQVAGDRPLPDLVVVLTDGDTPWDAAPPPENPSATYLAVLVAGGRWSVPPWLRTVVVDA